MYNIVHILRINHTIATRLPKGYGSRLSVYLSFVRPSSLETLQVQKPHSSKFLILKPHFEGTKSPSARHPMHQSTMPSSTLHDSSACYWSNKSLSIKMASMEIFVKYPRHQILTIFPHKIQFVSQCVAL